MNESLFTVIYGLAHRSTGLDQLIIFCATGLPWLVGLLVITTALILAFRERTISNGWTHRASFIILIPIATWVIAHVLKVFLNWSRPSLILSNVQPLFSADGATFPSGHATFFFALGFALYPFHPRLAIWVSMSAIVISLARVAAGVHFPGDILGGFVLAGLVTFISWSIVKTRFPAIGGHLMV